MTIKQFKTEFRSMCTDTWGDALDAWFECAGRLYVRGLKLPDEWEYRPAPAGRKYCVDKECRWYLEFRYLPTRELREIGCLLFRYCRWIKYWQDKRNHLL